LYKEACSVQAHLVLSEFVRVNSKIKINNVNSPYKKFIILLDCVAQETGSYIFGNKLPLIDLSFSK